MELLRHRFESQYEALKDGGWWALFLSNHDKPRQVSSLGDEGTYWEPSAKALALFLHGLPAPRLCMKGKNWA